MAEENKETEKVEKDSIVGLGDLEENNLQENQNNEDKDKDNLENKDKDNPENNPDNSDKENKEDTDKENKDGNKEGEDKKVDDLFNKAKTEGIDKLSEDEKKLLMDKGLLKQKNSDNKEDNKDNNTDEVTTKFKGALEAITGESIDVDFGDTPINTAEGLAKYLGAAKAKAVDDFEAILEERYPDAYKALQIAHNGGDVVEYFKNQNVQQTDYSKIEIEEDNSSQHKKIIRDAYKSRGLSEEEIDDIVKVAEDSNKLKDRATLGLKYLKETQAERTKEYEEGVLKQKTKDNQIKSAFANSIVEQIGKKVVKDFKIPDADVKPFTQHLLKNVQYRNGEFILTKKISAENLEEIAQYEFFAYKGGDLNKMVKAEAGTLLALELVDKANKDKNDFGANNNANDGQYLTLGEV